MIGIDTNVLVRYISQDDQHQSERAGAFMASLATADPGFISLVTLAEFCWVMNRKYKFSRDKFVKALLTLLNSQELLIEVDPVVREALELFDQSNADFGDCLIDRCSSAAGCDSTVTFDRKSAKALGMRLLR